MFDSSPLPAPDAKPPLNDAFKSTLSLAAGLKHLLMTF